jgi:prefoldin subunit 2
MRHVSCRTTTGLALGLALHVLVPCSGGATMVLVRDVAAAGRGRQTTAGDCSGAAYWRLTVRLVRALRGGDGEDAAVAPSDEERREREKMERDKELISQLQGMRNECNKLKRRINTVSEEIEEHEAAANVLGKFDSARPCKRAIGGVLMESSVGEVLPAVQNEKALLAKAAEEMTAKLRESEKQMTEFQKKHDIRIVSEELENAV